MEWKDRICFNPDVLGGKATIQGTRIAVDHVLKCLSDGWKVRDILDSYPQITESDVHACLAYAGDLVSSEHTYSL